MVTEAPPQPEVIPEYVQQALIADELPNLSSALVMLKMIPLKGQWPLPRSKKRTTLIFCGIRCSNT